MKNKVYVLMVIVLIMLTALTAACNKQSTQSATEAATEATTAAPTAAPTTTPTQLDTEQPTQAPTKAPTEAPVPETEAPAPTVDLNAEYKDELINNEWALFKVYADGEEFFPARYYGSSIRLGNKVEFYEDDTFYCVLGFSGCKGTYSIESGDITLHITTKYNGTSSEGNPSDEYTPLIWDRDTDTIQFKLNNADNLFTKK